MPGGVKLSIVLDRTPPIRGSLHHVESTLVIAGMLVVLVVFLFLRSVRATIIPAVAVAVSIIGTFGVMYLAGYSLDNLSLMALTIATGFVVDTVDEAIDATQRVAALDRRQCRAAFERRLTARRMAEDYVRLYRRLIASHLPQAGAAGASS